MARVATIILPTRNAQTARVQLAIILSEASSDDVSTLSASAAQTCATIAAGFKTRKDASLWRDIFQTPRLHVTISADEVRFDRVLRCYAVLSIRVVLNAYSDSYGKESISRIIESTSTRF